jgi:hypothetical protein
MVAGFAEIIEGEETQLRRLEMNMRGIAGKCVTVLK